LEKVIYFNFYDYWFCLLVYNYIENETIHPHQSKKLKL
jgi:hypothetical protein